MRKILALLESAALLPDLDGSFEITFCRTGVEAGRLLQQGFDGMILSLYLPGTDGIAFLEQNQMYLPPVVLVICPMPTPYIYQACAALGVGYILPIPCSGPEILQRMEDMFLKFETPVPDSSVIFARHHLRRLGLAPGKGFRRLEKILLKFDPDDDPFLYGDFYVDMAKQERVTMDAIDNSIHRTIQEAYDRRNEEIWQEYFSNTSHCPKNKEFIRAVAARIRPQLPFP